jgi:hypothetical protein
VDQTPQIEEGGQPGPSAARLLLSQSNRQCGPACKVGDGVDVSKRHDGSKRKPPATLSWLVERTSSGRLVGPSHHLRFRLRSERGLAAAFA